MRSQIRFRPVHPHFWHNYLPNEEQIGKHKNSIILQKIVYERKKASKENNSVEKIDALD